jgi:hypothetical protein
MQVGNEPFQQGNTTKPRRSLGCAFLLLPLAAVIMLGVSAWYTYTSYVFSTTGVEVPGTVVRLESSHSSEGGTTYSPVFSYTYDGQPYEYESVNSSNPPSNEVGDVETLLVNPNDPSKARQNSFWELWLVPCIMGPVSLFMLLLSIVIPLMVRKM